MVVATSSNGKRDLRDGSIEEEESNFGCVETRYSVPETDAQKDCIVLRKIGKRKCSVPAAGRNEEGSGWKGVVVRRSWTRAQVRKEA